MKTIKLLKELEKYPVFSLKNIKHIINKNSTYTKLVAYRLKKEGLIFEIERNKYTTHKDLLVISSNIIWPCYLSFWTALRYHNLTEQLPQDVFVISTRPKKTRNIKFNNINIVFTKVKPKYFFGYDKERYNDFNIFIADPEKAIIDSVLFKKISLSEISSIIKINIKILNKNRLLNYLLKIKDSSLIKRLGFILEKNNIDFYNRLRNYITSNYTYLDYAMPKRGKKNKKWRVIENVNQAR